MCNNIQYFTWNISIIHFVAEACQDFLFDPGYEAEKEHQNEMLQDCNIWPEYLTLLLSRPAEVNRKYFLDIYKNIRLKDSRWFEILWICLYFLYSKSLLWCKNQLLFFIFVSILSNIYFFSMRNNNTNGDHFIKHTLSLAKIHIH